MMAVIHFSFSLDKHAGFPPPHVTAAVDVNANDAVDAGETIVVSRDGNALRWHGSLTVGRDLDGLYTMVLFTASVGARFAIEFRQGGAQGPLLARVSNVVGKVPEVRFPVLRTGP